MRIISVFGGSTPQPGEPAYQQAEELGAQLAARGCMVANGGYCGTMEAVSRGAAEAGGTVIGVTCSRLEAYRPVGPNAWISEEVRVETVAERLRKLVTIGDGFIALPGGIGTLAEIAQSWSWMQTGEIERAPLILVGEAWKSVIDVFSANAQGYLAERDLALLSFEPDTAGAVRRLDEIWSDSRGWCGSPAG